jgi:hypothetical protein
MGSKQLANRTALLGPPSPATPRPERRTIRIGPGEMISREAVQGMAARGFRLVAVCKAGWTNGEFGYDYWFERGGTP